MRIANMSLFEHRPSFVKNSFLKKVFSRPKDHEPAHRAPEEAPLLHLHGARRAERARAGDAPPEGRDRAPAAEKPVRNAPAQAAGQIVARLPHLRANILGHLPPGEQRMAMHILAGGAFGRSLGPAPRFDTARELTEQQQMDLLRSPVMAQAVLDEARNKRSDAAGR